jgi:chemotaxis protein MotB
MPIGRRRQQRGGVDAWPGYVDALSTLLMVIIFVLLVFVLAQGFLSVALSSRDRALERLNRQVSELSELIALERGQAEELRGGLSRTAEELRAAAAARDSLARSLGLMREERDRLATERDATRVERDRLAARIADLDLASRGGTARVAELEGRLAEALVRAEAAGGDAAQTVRTLTEAQRALAAERAALETVRRDLAGVRDQAAALNRDLVTERTTREGRERELAETRAARDAALRERDVTRQELDARRQEAAALARDLAAARATLEAAQRDIAALQAEAARLDRTVQADRATIEARLSDIARLADQVRGLEALRDQLERQAAQALARAGEEERRRAAAEAARDQQAAQRAAAERATAEARQAVAAAGVLASEAASRAAEEERRRAAAEAQRGEFARLSDSAQAQIALLTRQLEALRAEVSRLAAALDTSEGAVRDREVQIAALGQRLNIALAQRVEELQQYRSDFFGRLRRVLGDRADVRIVGDRFVFQSEVLFPVGGADMSAAGQQQLRDLARVLIDLSRQFPPDLAWLLRVDGHADRVPIRGSARFATNWELSSARAIAVAQLLIAEGLPANRVAAAAFGDTQPLDDRDVPEAYARNRRIELRLTDR